MAKNKTLIIIAIAVILIFLSQNRQYTSQFAGSIAKDAKLALGNMMKKVDFFPKDPIGSTFQPQKLATNLYPGTSSDWCCDSSCDWQCIGSYDFCYNWCNVELCPESNAKPWCDPPQETCDAGYVLVDDGICCPIDFQAYCPQEDPPCYQSHWSCGNWGQCQNSQQTRSCWQNNQCAVESNKPSTTQACTCTESWSCGIWGDCIGGTQIRGCSDLNNCGTTLNKPLTTQSCVCAELWSCSAWSSCFNNQQTRVCTDSHQCGTLSKKPVESQSCTSDYTSFIIAKNDYIGGILSFQNFITESNKWINLPVTITSSISYTPSSFSMSNGCSGAIKIAPTSEYNLEVCLVGTDSLQEVAGSCKTYTSGEYGAGSSFSANPTSISSGNYKLRIKWKRIKDPSGNYDHGGTALSGSTSRCAEYTNSGITASGCSGDASYSRWSSTISIYSLPGCTGTRYYPYKCNYASCRIYEGGESQIGAGSSCAITGQLTSASCMDISGYSTYAPGQCVTLPYNGEKYLKDYANQAPDASKYYSSCTEGITSCPSNICTYAGDNLEYTSSFYIGSLSGSASVSFTRNIISSSGVIQW